MDLSDRELSRLEKLFDQQMWALGRDVQSSVGNLLARRALTRRPAPDGAAVSSTWVDEARGVELSSAGVRVMHPRGALFLGRGPLKPQLQGAPTAALGALAGWFSDYEAWVDVEAGPAWRAESLALRTRPARFTPAEARAAWAALHRLLSE
ncbi:MAG: hypothetical protein AB1730_27885 [Myxococcota bacterium]|jgi:hypothetical protein